MIEVDPNTFDFAVQVGTDGIDLGIETFDACRQINVAVPQVLEALEGEPIGAGLLGLGRHGGGDGVSSGTDTLSVAQPKASG